MPGAAPQKAEPTPEELGERPRAKLAELVSRQQAEFVRCSFCAVSDGAVDP